MPKQSKNVECAKLKYGSCFNGYMCAWDVFEICQNAQNSQIHQSNQDLTAKWLNQFWQQMVFMQIWVWIKCNAWMCYFII